MDSAVSLAPPAGNHSVSAARLVKVGLPVCNAHLKSDIRELGYSNCTVL